MLQDRSRLEKKIDRQEHFESQIADAEVLFEFAEEDETSVRELVSLIKSLEHDLSLAETEMLLAGDNDRRNAICTIHPGAGGTESQDWAEMLLRMYLKWAEQREFKAEVLEYQPGEEAGLKSVTFRVEGEYAYGLLAAEAGVHRLVRLAHQLRDRFHAGRIAREKRVCVRHYLEVGGAADGSEAGARFLDCVQWR